MDIGQGEGRPTALALGPRTDAFVTHVVGLSHSSDIER